MAYKEYIASEGNRLVILGGHTPIKRMFCPIDDEPEIIECSEEDALELQLYFEQLNEDPLNGVINDNNVDDIIEAYKDTPMMMSDDLDTPSLDENKIEYASKLREMALLLRAAFFLLEKGYDLNDNINTIVHL